MNRLTTRTVVGAAALAAVGAVFVAMLPVAVGLATVGIMMAGLAVVAFSTQSARLRDQKALIYRPVYVRSARVHRPVRSSDDE